MAGKRHVENISLHGIGSQGRKALGTFFVGSWLKRECDVRVSELHLKTTATDRAKRLWLVFLFAAPTGRRHWQVLNTPNTARHATAPRASNVNAAIRIKGMM
jgi:hypothetical protein